MATKEVMATAPLMVLLFDRTFLAGSIAQALRRRWGLYLGLAATLGGLAYLVVATRGRGGTAGFATPEALGAWEYIRSQPAAILHYLRLAVWPHPLCIDYGREAIVTNPATALSTGLVACALLGLTAWGLIRSKRWAVLAAWPAAVLAPSSLVPLHDVAFEHRMYLPLAAVIAALVLGAFSAGRGTICRAGTRPVATMPLIACLIAGVGVALGAVTHRRNADYRSEISIWTNTLAQAPQSARAQNGIGNALFGRGNVDEAIARYQKAVEIQPGYAEAHNNLGIALFSRGRIDEAVAHYQQALEIQPGFAAARDNLGNALAGRGQVDDAIAQYEKALGISADSAEIHNNLGKALVGRGQFEAAIVHCHKALEVKPDYAAAHNNLGNALAGCGRIDEAIAHYQRALEIQPDFAEARNNLGNVLSGRGRFDEAIDQYEKALEGKPDLAEAHYNLANALARRGRFDEAVTHFQHAIEAKPDLVVARSNLALALSEQQRTQKALARRREWLRSRPNDVVLLNDTAWTLATNPNASIRNGGDAVEMAERALKISAGNDLPVLDTLAAAYAEAGRFPEALRAARQALASAESHRNAALADKIRARLRLYETHKAYRDTR